VRVKIAMLRGARRPPGVKSNSAKSGKGRRSKYKRGSILIRQLRVVLGLQQAESFSPLALIFVAFCVVTGAFYAAIRRHDVELSFDQLSAFERHVNTFGNRTVYVVDPLQTDPVLSTLPHEDWTKISHKIDYIAILYGDIYTVSALPPEELVHTLGAALEKLRPHCYGIVLFSCGCLVHNVLFQHVSARFNGMECAMLPGFVFEEHAVRWVDIPESPRGCPARETVLSKPWFTLHSWSLAPARSEYSALRQHLAQTEHADRPEPEKKLNLYS
jgi:hypothetical protein